MVFSLAHGEHYCYRCRGFPQVSVRTAAAYVEKKCIIIIFIIRHIIKVYTCTARQHNNSTFISLFALLCVQCTHSAKTCLRCSLRDHLSGTRRFHTAATAADDEHTRSRTHADFVIFAMSLFTNRYNEIWQNGVLCVKMPPGMHTLVNGHQLPPSAGQQVYYSHCAAPKYTVAMTCRRSSCRTRSVQL